MQNLLETIDVAPATMKAQGSVITFYIGAVVVILITLSLIPSINTAVASSGLTGAALAIADLLVLLMIVSLLYLIGRGGGVL
jgi:small-conductance mechanosensitive channel